MIFKLIFLFFYYCKIESLNGHSLWTADSLAPETDFCASSSTSCTTQMPRPPAVAAAAAGGGGGGRGGVEWIDILAVTY